MKRLLWHWLPPLAWMGLIFLLSSQPTLPSVPGGWDVLLKKVGHALAYGVLAWLYQRALRRHFSTLATLRIVSIGLALAYALSDEYHQTFVAGRNGNLVDVAVDVVGMCGAMLLDWRLEHRRAQPGPMSAVR